MSWLTPKLAGRAQDLKPLRPTDADEAVAIEKIRVSMLAALDTGAGTGDRPCRLKSRIAHAPDAQGLWALRGELMAVLAGDQGEARAVGKLQQLTSLFRDVLPQGLASSLGHLGQRERHAVNDASMQLRQQR